MSDLLSIGKSGLFAAKKSLQTTGHNIANANTEGYSRQRVDLSTATPIVKEGLIQGSGVWVRGINRVHDQYLEKRLDSSISNNNFHNERYQQLSQVEEIFNEVNGVGMNQILSKFYNSFRELANQPEDQTIRSVVRDSADLVAKDFKRVIGTLNNLSKNIDLQIDQFSVDINGLTSSISKTNKQIAYLEATGAETGDLRDQRDQLIRNLAEYFSINTYLDDHGNYVVNAKGVGTLVAGGANQEIKVSGTNEKNSSNGMENSLEIFFANRPGEKITGKFQDGKLASVLKVRNEDIVDLKNKMDRLAFEFSSSVNAIHRRGFVNRKIEMDKSGRDLASSDDRKITNIDFFKQPLEVKNAAINLDLSEEIHKDLNNIATALEPNGPGDNRVALGISKLQHEKILNDNTTTLEEFYLQVVGGIGLSVGKAQFDSEQSEGILSQVKAIKERLAGVSIDEETANMVRFQHVYDASAKVLKTADEMFETVLNIKR